MKIFFRFTQTNPQKLENLNRYVNTFCIVSAQAFEKLKPIELVNPKSFTNINNTVNPIKFLFNQQSIFVQQDILHQATLKTALSRIEFWIDVAERLTQKNNYFSAQAIYSALNTAVISRLMENDQAPAKNLLSQSAKNKFKKLADLYDSTNQSKDALISRVKKMNGPKLLHIDLIESAVIKHNAVIENLELKKLNFNEELNTASEEEKNNINLDIEKTEKEITVTKEEFKKKILTQFKERYSDFKPQIQDIKVDPDVYNGLFAKNIIDYLGAYDELGSLKRETTNLEEKYSRNINNLTKLNASGSEKIELKKSGLIYQKNQKKSIATPNIFIQQTTELSSPQNLQGKKTHSQNLLEICDIELCDMEIEICDIELEIIENSLKKLEESNHAKLTNSIKENKSRLTKIEERSMELKQIVNPFDSNLNNLSNKLKPRTAVKSRSDSCCLFQSKNPFNSQSSTDIPPLNFNQSKKRNAF